MINADSWRMGVVLEQLTSLYELYALVTIQTDRQTDRQIEGEREREIGKGR